MRIDAHNVENCKIILTYLRKSAIIDVVQKEVPFVAVCYKKLWKILIDRDMTKSELRIKAGLSTNALAKLGKGESVSIDVLDKICCCLHCDIGDIMEIISDTGITVEENNENRIVVNDDAETWKVVSLFAGCGGLDLGFRGDFTFLNKHYPRNRFEIIWANEINKAACATYRENVDRRIIEGPIEEKFSYLPETADIVIGGFPCQDISINGKMAGVDGERSGLYVWMVRAVEKLRPKVFVAENVKALLMKRHTSSLERVITDFSELGYNISYHLYNAADYGVPQIRERVIIVGVRKDIKNEFIPPLAVTSERPITAKEAIDDLAKHPMDESISHIWSAAKPSSGQGLRYLTANNPATTMRSECHGNLQFHYSQPRRISMREAARIQSFPDDFEFVAKLRETERMIGNAVPPVFAWHIAQSVMQVLGNGVSNPNG